MFVAVATLAAASVVGTVLAARSDGDERAAGAPATSSGPPVRVVVPGRPGESARVAAADGVRAPDVSTYNGADVTFMQAMIVHHAQALQMARIAAERATDERVRALAQRIDVAQTGEINQIRGWLSQRKLPTADPAHDHATMPGMQTDADLAALAAAAGAQLDRRFITMMSAHHRGGIAMARTVLTGGTDQAVNELAADVVVEQDAEIRRMAQLDIR